MKDLKILGGIAFLHWYDTDIADDQDIIYADELLGKDLQWNEDETDDEIVEIPEQDKRDAHSSANRMIEGIKEGEVTVLPDNVQYHILLLSAEKGRGMIRKYMRGQYADLQHNVKAWESDIRLINAFGTSDIKPQKYVVRLKHLLKYCKTNPTKQLTKKEFYERLSTELSGVSPAVLTAILEDTELPDAVAVRALAYIRSKMFADAEEDASRNLDGIACQWLKAWLIRKNGRNEEKLMEEYNKDHPNPAYHCGAMMAIYAAIQQDADPNVNVSVVQRFYASALQSPALVIGRLSQLSVHHLEKLESKSTAAANRYRDQLAQCSVSIGNSVPTTLNLAQQSYFALGYYQMQAKLSQETKERIAIARERKQNKQTEGEE